MESIGANNFFCYSVVFFEEWHAAAIVAGARVSPRFGYLERTNNPRTKIYFSVINVHSIRDENTRRSQ